MPTDKKQMPMMPQKIITDDEIITPGYEGEILTVSQVSDELYRLWLRWVTTQNKKYTRETYEFERNIGREIPMAARELVAGTWQMGQLRKFYTKRPRREINTPPYIDRLAQAWIVEKYLKPFVTPRIYDGNMACQKGKGTHKARKLMKQLLVDAYMQYGYKFCFFQYDMQGYFDNLSHNHIRALFASLPSHGRRLVYNNLQAFHNTPKTSYAAAADPRHWYGIPKGTLPSQWTGIYYLNGLAEELLAMDECLGGVQYMDDGIFLFRSKKSAREAKLFTESYLVNHQMGIRLHPRKSAYAPITRGFNFLGWHYEIKPSGKILMHIKQEKKKEIKNRLEHLQKAYACGEITIEEVNQVMCQTLHYLEEGDTYFLRKYLCNRYTFQRDDLGQ